MRQNIAGRRRRSQWFAILLGLLLFGLSGSARAQESNRQRAFVYGINAALANTYTGNFAGRSDQCDLATND